MTTYYNEHDPHAAAWLRNLIAAGLIAPGVVDERSIRDVAVHDLRGFVHCHFFAGIGVWSGALRAAGWPDDRPVWTGSCPCQPFSAAGACEAFDDPRHLWPEFFRLIEECRPRTVFGEQVASNHGLAWIDVVQADLERAGYAVAPVDFCAASVGAPHIRQRLYFVADALADRDGDGRAEGVRGRSLRGEYNPEYGGRTGVVADGASFGRGGGTGSRDSGSGGFGGLVPADDGGVGALADCDGRSIPHAPALSRIGRPGAVNGGWRDADWLFCRDARWRPVEPGTLPLVDGDSAGLDAGGALAGKSRPALLKGYGNAIVFPQAVAFIDAARRAIDGLP